MPLVAHSNPSSISLVHDVCLVLRLRSALTLPHPNMLLSQKFTGKASPESACVSTYATPVPEFDVARVKLPAGAAEPLAGLPGPSIAIVTGGAGTAELEAGAATALRTGQVLFIPADAVLPLAAGPDGLQLHRAFTVCE
eukprot:m.227529 g.227529  ORF g.227529 m.227529 type:complete len:139 (+) comp19245_c0_seq2:1326-1742(+)